MPSAHLLAAPVLAFFFGSTTRRRPQCQHLRRLALGVLCVLGLQSTPQAGQQNRTEPVRMESVTIGERGTEIFVRFDRPISHERSSLFRLLNGKIVETIHPRLQAAPTVMFARIVTPVPGEYLERWTVRPQGSQVVAELNKQPSSRGGMWRVERLQRAVRRLVDERAPSFWGARPGARPTPAWFRPSLPCDAPTPTSPCVR
jgi:hypothetical protein